MDYVSDWKKRNLLKKQAHRDYKQARGTLHLRQLQTGLKVLLENVTAYRQQISILIRNRKSLEQARDERLQLALEHEIAHTRLSEVPGIGEKFAQEIVSGVFKTRLSDLTVAHQLPGIGENKQEQINQWITRYEGLIPVMMADDYPGKTEILATFSPKIEHIHQEISYLDENNNEMQTLIRRAEVEIEKLVQFSADDFFQALVDPGSVDRAALDQYLLGIYPVWEPMPDWFQAAIQTGRR
jgi:hypothetical protein